MLALAAAAVIAAAAVAPPPAVVAASANVACEKVACGQGLLLARARSLANLARSLTCSSRGGVITTAKDPIDAGPASSAAECLRRPPHTLVRLGRRVVQSPRWARFARLQRRVGVVVLNVLRGILVGGTDRPLVVLPPAVPPRGLLLRWKLQGAIAAASAAPRPHPHPVPPSKAAPSWAVCRFGKARDAVLLPNLWVARRQQHIARHCSLRGGSTDVPARGRRFAEVINNKRQDTPAR